MISKSKKTTQKRKKPARKSSLRTFLKWAVAVGVAGALSGFLLLVFVFSYIYQELPPLDAVTNYHPRVPLRVWSADGKLLAEFGEEHRDFVAIKDVPLDVRHAILAAEDDGFYEHPGIEITGILRAAITNALTGRRGQGGSTITQQVARNFFLTTDRTYKRKLYEIAMSFKIEHMLTKDQILEIYINQIYLGQRSYGFQSAARTYFGRSLDQLTIGEAATLAGLPVAPSAYNPIVNPAAATMRKNYVLRRMYDLHYIDEATYAREKAAPMQTRRTPTADEMIANGLAREHVEADYASELARVLVYDIFKDETYSRGLNVYTTINSVDQKAAVDAVRSALVSYDRKYGYRGPEGFVDISDAASRAKTIRTTLANTRSSPVMVPAVVTSASTKGIRAAISSKESVDLDADSLRFGRRYLTKRKDGRELRPGSIIRVMRSKDNKGWTLGQVPEVEAAFIAGDYNTGAVRAFVGGFDFNINKFNHVTQAWRQPGSSFKPFIYSAALDKGFTPTTIINDAPISIDPKLTGNKLWEPRNYENRFDGPMTMREGLQRSKNLVTIRIMQAIGPEYAQEFIGRFGFSPEQHPANLPMALGAGSVTPWQMFGAYSTFANGGFLVKPYLIERVTDVTGRTLMRNTGRTAGDEAIRAISDRNAYVMDSLLHGVATRGTARRSTRELKRNDIGGKTGTTNNAYDAWFCGYTGDQVGVSWIGYDTPRPLGARETGGGLALPVWIDYMRVAEKDRPDAVRVQPESVVNIDGEVYYKDPIKAPVLEGDRPIELDHDEQDVIRNQIF